MDLTKICARPGTKHTPTEASREVGKEVDREVDKVVDKEVPKNGTPSFKINHFYL